MSEGQQFSLSEVVDLFVKFHNQVNSNEENAKAELELEIASRSKKKKKNLLTANASKAKQLISEWLVLDYLEKSGFGVVKKKLLRAKPIENENELKPLVKSLGLNSLKDLLEKFAEKGCKEKNLTTCHSKKRKRHVEEQLLESGERKKSRKHTALVEEERKKKKKRKCSTEVTDEVETRRESKKKKKNERCALSEERIEKKGKENRENESFQNTNLSNSSYIEERGTQTDPLLVQDPENYHQYHQGVQQDLSLTNIQNQSGLLLANAANPCNYPPPGQGNVFAKPWDFLHLPPPCVKPPQRHETVFSHQGYGQMDNYRQASHVQRANFGQTSQGQMDRGTQSCSTQFETFWPFRSTFERPDPLFSRPPPPLQPSHFHTRPIQQNVSKFYRQNSREATEDVFIDLITISSDEDHSNNDNQQTQSNLTTLGTNPSSSDSTSSKDRTGNDRSNATSDQQNSRVLHRYSMAEDRQFSRKTSTPIHCPRNQLLISNNVDLQSNRNSVPQAVQSPNTSVTIKQEQNSPSNLNSLHTLNSAKPYNTTRDANSSSSSESEPAIQIKQEKVSPKRLNDATSMRTPPSGVLVKREKSTPVKSFTNQNKSLASSTPSTSLQISRPVAIQKTLKVTSTNVNQDDTSSEESSSSEDEIVPSNSAKQQSSGISRPNRKPTIVLPPWMNSRSTALNLYWRPGQSKLCQDSLDAPTYAIFNHRTPATTTSSSSSSEDSDNGNDNDKHTVIDHSKQSRVSLHSRPWSNQGNKYNSKSFNQTSGVLQAKFAAIAERVEAIQPMSNTNQDDFTAGVNLKELVQNASHTRKSHFGNSRSKSIEARLAGVGQKVQAIAQKTNSVQSISKTGINPSCPNPSLFHSQVRTGLNKSSPTLAVKPTLQARAVLRPPVRSAPKTSSAFSSQSRNVPSSSDDSSDDDQPPKPRPKLVTSNKKIPSRLVTPAPAKSLPFTRTTLSTKSLTTTAPARRNLSLSAEEIHSKTEQMIPMTTRQDVRGHSLDELVPIQMGYSDLYEHLLPECSEVDRVVKYILDLNIPIRYLNVKFSHHVVLGELDSFKAACPKFRHQRYTPGEAGDEGNIVKSWKKLIRDANIKNPVKCLENFQKSKKLRINIKKKNVLGCYFGQNLPNVRAAASIFHFACKSILTESKGKFTKQEDDTILDFVAKYGVNKTTWKLLEEELGRDTMSLTSRYRGTLKNREHVTGKWSIVEDEICLEILFKDRNSDPDLIESITYREIQPVAQELGRQVRLVTNHWEYRLKPILLSYHQMCLFTNSKPPFFYFLIDKKVRVVQEIDWVEVKKRFPSQTATGLVMELSNQINALDLQNPNEIHLPVYLKLQNNASDWSDKEISTRAKLYRERIVEIYDKQRKLPRN